MDPKLELQQLKDFLAIPENEKLFFEERLERYITLELLIEAENQRVNEIQLLSKIKVEDELDRVKSNPLIVRIGRKSRRVAIEKKLKRAKKKYILIFFFLQFFIILEDTSLEQLTHDQTWILDIILEKDNKLGSLLTVDSLLLSDFKTYFEKLDNLKNLLNEASKQYLILDSIIKKQSLKTNGWIYNILFNRIKKNLRNQLAITTKEWRNTEFIRQTQTTKSFSEFKIIEKKKKIKLLLNDKKLIITIFKCVTLTKPRLKTKKTIKKIFNRIKKNKVINIIITLFNQLLFRRGLLWKDITRSMKKHKWYLIGKDYKVYQKRLGWTFKSQTKKYYNRSLNKRKLKQLNPKFIKCVELYFNRELKNQFMRVVKKIYHINTYLKYFYYRFYKQFQKYQDKLFDQNFVIPYKNKILSFEETLDNLETAKRAEKKKIFRVILLIHKHKFEKFLLKTYQKKFEPPLDFFLNKLEKERYYPKSKRSKFSARVKKWLNKYINDELIREYREASSRPRVIIEKGEEEIEANYPYLPRAPLLFERDVSIKEFKTKKPVKYDIIRFTKPTITLQSNYFKFKKSGINSVTKNLLYTKFNSKINTPIRVQRIFNSCEKFYKNFFKDNSYISYKNFFQHLKVLFLYKPHLRVNKNFLMIYFGSLLYKPIIDGITEEQAYATRLHDFLNNFLIRLRLYKRTHLADSIYRFTRSYILPKPEKAKLIKTFMHKTRAIRIKKPNYRVMNYMYIRSLKRLTIRIRSNIGAVRGTMPLFKHNLIATDMCSPMNLKKRFKNKEYHYLFQPDINARVKSKYRSYTSALKRNYGFSITYHTNARFYYYSPFNLFLKELYGGMRSEDDIVEKYMKVIPKTKYHD